MFRSGTIRQNFWVPSQTFSVQSFAKVPSMVEILISENLCPKEGNTAPQPHSVATWAF